MDKSAKAWLTKLESIGKETNVSPARLMNWLLKGFGIDRDIRFLNTDTLSLNQKTRIESAIVRLTAHEPISKILEEQEFYGRKFKTTRDTLDPRMDSETLIDAMLKHLKKNEAPKLLDLGTGTGCLLITLLAELPHATGLAVDICSKALSIAKENAESHGVSERIEFIQSNWCANITGSFDGIISNPPYITDNYPLDPSVALYDPKQALFGGTDGLDPYRILFDQMPPLCKPTTKIVFEIGFDQSKSVPALGAKNGFTLIESCVDTNGIPRALVFKQRNT